MWVFFNKYSWHFVSVDFTSAGSTNHGSTTVFSKLNPWLQRTNCRVKSYVCSGGHPYLRVVQGPNCALWAPCKFVVVHISTKTRAALTEDQRLGGLNNGNVLPTILETGGPRSGWQHSRVQVQVLYRVMSSLGFAWRKHTHTETERHPQRKSETEREREKSLVSPLFIRALIPS